MPDLDPTDDDLRAFARNLFAPDAPDDAEPDADDEPDEPDDDTRTTRSLFA